MGVPHAGPADSIAIPRGLHTAYSKTVFLSLTYGPKETGFRPSGTILGLSEDYESSQSTGEVSSGETIIADERISKNHGSATHPPGCGRLRRQTDGGRHVGLHLRPRRDWGLVWNQVLETGGLMVGNDVRITMDIEARPPEPDSLTADMMKLTQSSFLGPFQPEHRP